MLSKSLQYLNLMLISQISPVGCELVANDRDVMLNDPVILKPTQAKRQVETMDDVTNFPE